MQRGDSMVIKKVIYNEDDNYTPLDSEQVFGPADKLPTQSPLIQAQRAQEDAVKAAGMATNYITDTRDGVWITPPDAKPNEDGTPNARTSGWRIRDALELYRKGVSVIKSWFDEPPEEDDGEVYGAKTRIGPEDSSHIEIEESQLDFYADDDGAVKKVFSMYTLDDGVPCLETEDEMHIGAEALHLPNTDISVEQYSSLYNALIGIDWPDRASVNLQDILAYILTHM